LGDERREKNRGIEEGKSLGINAGIIPLLVDITLKRLD